MKNSANPLCSVGNPLFGSNTCGSISFPSLLEIHRYLENHWPELENLVGNSWPQPKLESHEVEDEGDDFDLCKIWNFTEEDIKGADHQPLEDDDSSVDDSNPVNRYARFSRFWIDNDSDDMSSLNSEELNALCDDVSDMDLQHIPQPPPSQRHHMWLPVSKEEGTLVKTRYASIALEEFNKQQDVCYEYVSTVTLKTTTGSLDEFGDITGHHMNFWAKLKGSNDPPELFFGSLGSEPGEVHCCKLTSRPDSSELLHCEHVQCLECDLWIKR